MKKLWEATKKIKINSNLYQFEKLILQKYNLNFKHNYQKILKWSINNSSIFWHEICVRFFCKKCPPVFAHLSTPIPGI